VLLVATLGTVAFGALFGFSKTNGGEIAVVRNGGWFDNNRIRQVIQPGSELTWTGFWSTTHKYPAQQRFYTMTADPARGGRPGIDVARTPSRDGVDMGIEATIYFTLNLDEQTLRLFDDKYGTRQFRGADDKLRYPWEGVDGWNTFFDAAVRPVIDNDIREQIGRFRCAELVSSCSLVQNGAGAAAGPPGAQEDNTSISQAQDAINQSLPRNIRANLGGDFFQNIRFNLVRVALPQQVQDAVNRAQAAFAAVSEAQARVAQAQAEAEANKKRQEGYTACPACAEIDKIRALPPGVTTYAPGAGTSIPVR
jgi:regulator of protease activity HflC (stomatin/prohibitin superfamily)